MGLLDTTTLESYHSDGGYGNYGGDYGTYQFTSLEDIINQFMVVYVGEDKIIPKAKRLDVAFFAQRALAELSFDTLKSCKALEILVPASLQMILPQDYVNYTKISWVDSAGIKHLIHPTSKTSNPKHYYQNKEGNHVMNPIGTLTKDSNIVVLDGDYSGVLIHGMRVEGPNLKGNSYIHNITTTGGITSITLENKAGTNDKEALATTNEELAIARFSYLGYGLRLAKGSLIETTTTAAASVGDTSLTLTSVAGIKVGMFINHPSFVNGSIPVIDGGEIAIHVVGVGLTTVELSHQISGNAVGSGDTVGFVSNSDDSSAWLDYKSGTPSENQNDYQDDTYWPLDGARYGLDPQHAQVNGSFYMDCDAGKINFSSNISGKTVILDYISDSLGTDGEMQVHKFAEEAMYKWIAHAILATRANTPEYLVQRFKKERFAAIRTAKLRLSNLKLEELTQILRGKSKQIKH